MKIRQAVVLGAWICAVAGCRNDPTRDLLERDNFHKEREIYQLKSQIQDLEERLAATSPASASQRAVTRPGTSSDALAEPGRLEPAPSFGRPGPALLPPAKKAEDPALPEIGPLNISPGVEGPPGEVPRTLGGKSGSATPRGPSRGDSSRWTPSNVQPVSGVAAVDNQAVAQITLHPSLTGGIGSGTSGDEGLLVVVEPRDFAGNILPVAGETSVALFDPALSGEQARLARWDFSAAEAERVLHTGTEPGIHLRLPWRLAPAHERLRVFVRYTTRDGRKLQAEREIAVALGSSEARPSADEAGSRDALRRDEAAEAARRRTGSQRPQWSPDRD